MVFSYTRNVQVQGFMQVLVEHGRIYPEDS